MSANAETPVRLSVVIPAFNEQTTIADVVAEAAGVLRTIEGDHEILVCDDGSSDNTWQVLQTLSEEEPMLRPLAHPRNRGNIAARQTLVDAARGDIIFHVGADGEWVMADMVPMLAEIERGADVVIGVRTDKQYTAWRKLVSFSFNWLVALLWGQHFGDLGSLRMARASLWKRIPYDSSSAFVTAQRVLTARHNGAKITTVPVGHRARRAGKSSFGSPARAAEAMRDLIAFRLSGRWKVDIGWRRS